MGNTSVTGEDGQWEVREFVSGSGRGSSRRGRMGSSRFEGPPQTVQGSRTRPGHGRDESPVAEDRPGGIARGVGGGTTGSVEWDRSLGRTRGKGTVGVPRGPTPFAGKRFGG